MALYRLHVKKGIEAPEDWSRVLIPFAGTGLRLKEMFARDCVIEASPLLLKEILNQLGEYLEPFDYDPMERDIINRKSQQEEDDGLDWL